MAVTPINSIYSNLPTKSKSLLTFRGDTEQAAPASQEVQNEPENTQSYEQPKKHSYLGTLAAIVLIGVILLLLAKAAGRGEGETIEQAGKKAADASETFVESVEDEIDAVKG